MTAITSEPPSQPSTSPRASGSGSPGVGSSRPHESAHLHVAGAAPYIDDQPELAGTLHAALGVSPMAHGTLLAIDLALLRAQPGVLAVYAAQDLPGRNDCGRILQDDPILADGTLRHVGQPVFAIVASTRELARSAAALANQALKIVPLPAILTALDAHAQQQRCIAAPNTPARCGATAASQRTGARATDPMNRGGINASPIFGSGSGWRSACRHR